MIQRVLTEPLKTEYLSLDGAHPEWSERRIDAVFFASHGEADGRAEALRIQTGERAIYAAVAQKPMPIVHRPVVVPNGISKLRELPAKPVKRTRRADRDREEMRRHDIEELEEVAING